MARAALPTGQHSDQAESLTVTGGAGINGKHGRFRHGGTIAIERDSIAIDRRGDRLPATSGKRDVGTIKINADSISISGIQAPQRPSRSCRDVRSLGGRGTGRIGNAGTIDITTRTLDVTRGALLNAESLSRSFTAQPGGNAGKNNGRRRTPCTSVSGAADPRQPNGHPVITASSNTTGYAGAIDITTAR